MLTYVGVVVLAAVVVGIAFVSQRFSNEVSGQQAELVNVNANTLSPEEANNLVRANKSNKKFVILDVRTPEEFAEEHIENARNLSFDAENFKSEINKLHRNQKYLVYCKTGGKSGKTVNMMRENGLKEIYYLQGGLAKWKEANLPLTK